MTAILSTCGNYRYELQRDIDIFIRRTLLVVMCNPSVADAFRDDRTIGRLREFCKRWRFGQLLVGNACAWRATDQNELERVADPVGPANDAHLASLAARADMLICAWGTNTIANQRADAVCAILRAGGKPIHHLGLNGDGSPKHPLYLRGDTQPQLWNRAA